MDKKTIQELLAMSGAELRAYLQSLPEDERRAIDEELSNAIEAATSRNLEVKRNQKANNS